MNQERIKGGYILIARKLLQSGIMEKPPLYLKVWLWMLLQASFKDHGSLKRGQFFTSLKSMQTAMGYKIGYRRNAPTIKEIRSATKFLTKVYMIVTMKVTHGIIITILNYDYYQDFSNYEGHNEGQTKGHTEGEILRNKDNKKENSQDISAKISFLLKRYTNHSLLQETFKAISSTRKTNRITENMKLSILKSWENYPIRLVETGLKIYLEKDYASQGRNEKYLLGIIRNSKESNPSKADSKTPEWF